MANMKWTRATRLRLAAKLRLRPSQVGYLFRAIAEYRRRLTFIHEHGTSVETCSLAVIATGFVESNWKIYANSAVPGSMHIPHDAIGHDHLSVGPLQQQVPMWGSVSACMSIEGSAAKFLNHLVRLNPHNPRDARTIGQLCQRVQVSAFPDRYQGQVGRAQSAYDAIAPYVIANVKAG